MNTLAPARKNSRGRRLLAYDILEPPHLRCSIDLTKLLPTDKERESFEKKWPHFYASDEANKDVYKRKEDVLIYKSEQLIPSKRDKRPALLLVFGNPASHSVKSGMFFAFKGGGKENRFWKHLLKPSGILKLPVDTTKSAQNLNAQRRDVLLNLQYESPYRIGLCVFISMPSPPGGTWGGVAGVQRLIGIRAMRRLEEAETERIIKLSRKYVRKNGALVSFQKNAWNALRSNQDAPYKIELARSGKLVGTIKGNPDIPLLGVPPTRLAGPCRKILTNIPELI